MPANYSLMDATSEILLMLLAAFLLGWLFCWLMKKLFGGKPEIVQPANKDLNKAVNQNASDSDLTIPTKEKLSDTADDIELTTDSPSETEVNLNEVDLPNKPTVAADTDRPKIKKPRPRIDLPDFNTPDLNIKDSINMGGETGRATLDKGLGVAAAGIGAIAASAGSLKDKAVGETEKLDADIPEVDLPDTNINLSDIETTDFETEIDLPEVERASLNADIELPEIPELDTPETNDVLAASMPDLETSSASSVISDTLETEVDEISASLDNAADTETNTVEASSAINSANDTLTHPEFPTNADSNEAEEADQEEADDLTRISGIDAQVCEILNTQGIHSYKDLQRSNRTLLKSHLDDSGDAKIRELEPASWPHQATLCEDRNWSKLSEYQSFLTGSNLDTRQTNTPTYSVGDGDDLKKVEGIGPFFESLLNDAGITTYEHLKNSDRDTLKEIIDAAGPDYRMHEPETWPYQAGLAYREEWKKLQDYIQFMTGRS